MKISIHKNKRLYILLVITLSNTGNLTFFVVYYYILHCFTKYYLLNFDLLIQKNNFKLIIWFTMYDLCTYQSNYWQFLKHWIILLFQFWMIKKWEVKINSRPSSSGRYRFSFPKDMPCSACESHQNQQDKSYNR